MGIRRRIAVAALSILVMVATVSTEARPATAGDQVLGDPGATLALVDGDAVVFRTSPNGHSAKGTSSTERGVVHHDGYATFGEPVLLEHYEVRLVSSHRIEEVRPYVLDAAGAATAVGGQSLSVRRAVVAPGGPSRGQIDVVVSSSSPCSGWWLACGGPHIDDDGTIVNGRIWVNPRLLDRPAHEIANTVRHELGHTLGLAHYEHRHHDRIQTMHPKSFEAAVYEAGDTAGLRALAGSGGAGRVLLDGVDHEAGQLAAHGRVFGAADGSVLLLEVDGVPSRHPIDGTAFRHRFDTVAGPHVVCASLERAGGISSRNCANGMVPGEPVGVLESVTAGSLGVVVSGWATDPRRPDPVTVQVRIDGEIIEGRADDVRADGAAHGFTVARDVPAGPHEVCVHVPDVGGGPGADLGCRFVLVSDHTFGELGLQAL